MSTFGAQQILPIVKLRMDLTTRLMYAIIDTSKKEKEKSTKSCYQTVT